MRILQKILSRSCQDPSGSFKILQDPWQDPWRSWQESWKILEDPGGSLKILTRIFKDLDQDPHKDPREDPRRSLKILQRFSPGKLPKEMCVLFIHKNLPLMVYVWMHKYWKLNNRSAKKTQCFGQTTPLRESFNPIRDVATVLLWMYATKPYIILSLIKYVYCTKQCY